MKNCNFKKSIKNYLNNKFINYTLLNLVESLFSFDIFEYLLNFFKEYFHLLKK